MSNKTKILGSIITFAIMLLVYACANKAQGPTGGPKDKTPPSVMRSTPANGALNFKKKLIEIDFDKIVSVEKASDNVVVSPPQQKPPEVKSLGRRVTVNFNENLQDTTTYSINFGNAIADVNEKNVLKNYLFSFSTGSTIDTLRISGTVINAEDLNPLSGIIVGIHKENTSDSVFMLKPFMRIGKTDENGRFSVDNIKKGKYKVYALGDANQDYIFQPGEGLAFRDSLVSPYTRIEEMKDTVWKDSTEVDSIRTYMGTRFLPDNLALRYFKENKKRQYFVKFERKEPFVFSLFFNTTQAKLPEFKPLNFKWDGKYLLQKSAGFDSLTFWLTDSLLWKKDTLRMTMSYLKTDSLFRLKPVTDTISVFMRKGRINPHAKPKKIVVQKVQPLKFFNNMAQAFEIYNPVKLNFEAPLEHLDVKKVRLFQKVDTTFKQIPFKWREADSTKMAYDIDHKWIAETTYKLEIDSAAFTSIYHRTSGKLKTEFKIRSLDEYSSVKLLLAKFNPKAVLQILDAKDVVLGTKPASAKGTVFEYLKPGDYYVRMFIDENGNGKWDTGDYSKKLQPEEVYYYPKKMTLLANWEFEETWDYTLVPLLQQKPLELIKATTTEKKNQTNN